MTCCGLERDSQFCPKCGKLLAPWNEKPVRWVKAEKSGERVQITIYPDRHRIPMCREVDRDEAMLLFKELGVLLGMSEYSGATVSDG